MLLISTLCIDLFLYIDIHSYSKYGMTRVPSHIHLSKNTDSILYIRFLPCFSTARIMIYFFKYPAYFSSNAPVISDWNSRCMLIKAL